MAEPNDPQATPRTDATVRKMAGYWRQGAVDFARQLEREINTEQKQLTQKTAEVEALAQQVASIRFVKKQVCEENAQLKREVERLQNVLNWIADVERSDKMSDIVQEARSAADAWWDNPQSSATACNKEHEYGAITGYINGYIAGCGSKDRLIRELVKALNDVKEDCPDCDNSGISIVHAHSGPKQQQCQWCHQKQNSVFNIENILTVAKAQGYEP